VGLSGLAAAAALAGLLVFRPFWSKPIDAAELARVKQQSATLEQQLQRYDPDARVTSGRSAALAPSWKTVLPLSTASWHSWVPFEPGASCRSRHTVAAARGPMEQLVSVHVTRAAYVGL